MFSVHYTGSDKKISEHSTFERAMISAVGTHRITSGTIPELTIRSEGGGAIAKIDINGAVVLNAPTARMLWL